MRIARGISRTALLIGPWAIKVPTTRPYGKREDRLWAWTRGYQANYSELQWCEVDGVCPVVWHIGSLVVCFKRCEPVTAKDWPYEPEDPMWKTISPMVIFGDPKLSNLGWLPTTSSELPGAPELPAKHLVWIDYDGSFNGCPHSREVYDNADD